MQSNKRPMYDIGDLKEHPAQLYEMAVQFSQFFECRLEHQTAEIWHVLQKVSDSLWGNLPPVVVIDYRDPDDSATWGVWVPGSEPWPHLGTHAADEMP